MALSPFIVGIDLGTTNTTLAFATSDQVDSKEAVPIHSFPIPQVIQPGRIESRPLLPSFLYLPQGGEVPEGSLQLPWDPAIKHTVGELARSQCSLTPSRVVASAKSWLCHAGVDRRSNILPWKADEKAKKVSPVDASAMYLQHVREAWQHAHAQLPPEHQLDKQEIILTVPASFDAVARTLTVDAAQAAGLPHVVLLEEPQAAFYAWLDAHHRDWRDLVKVGDVILICDVGGGTTDFTLIAVSDHEGRLELHRLAVGDHILLGGDNMDLALAHFAMQKLQGAKLDLMQMQALSHSCRAAKEQLLSDSTIASVPVTVLGRGRSVVGGSLRTELTRADVEKLLVEGFFPVCELNAEVKRTQATGLQELGLPYAADPVISKHLASFLRRNEPVLKEHFTKTGTKIRTLPNCLLCNGGVFKATQLRERLHQLLTQWSQAAGGGPVKMLEGTDLDQAVARGAAYYGLVQHGRGIRIRGGTAQAYYIGVETSLPAVPGMPAPLRAVCVAPFGMEEDTEADLPNHEFGLIVGEPVQFRFLGSSQRRHDPVGTVIENWEDELTELSPLTMTLPGSASNANATVPVRLRSKVTPIGTLELWLVSREGDQQWKLEFNVREQRD